MHRRYLAIIALSCLAVAPATRPADVGSLIDGLADRDPVVRADAVKQLQKIGPPAREALQAALEDPDPEVRTRAAALLGSMSLVRPGDSPAVRKLLEQFRAADPTSRAALLNDEPFLRNGQAALTALIRILTDAPGEDDRWAASRTLQARRDADTARQLRDIDTTNRDSVPLLITVGIAWQGRDTPKAVALLRRATTLVAERGGPVDIEVLGVFLALTNQAVQAHQFDDAATLLRQRASLGETAWPVAPAALELLALHANFGPLPGFAQDLASIGPVVLTGADGRYCAARLLQRSRKPLVAEAVAAATLHRLGDVGPDDRIATGQFLLQHGWDDWAESEFLAGLDVATPETENDLLLRLASLAADGGDPGRAADYLDRVIAALPPGNQMIRTNRQGNQQIVFDAMLRNEAAAQRLRAATASGDKKAIGEQLDQLTQNPSLDIDLASEVLPAMRKQGRKAEADTLFLRIYGEYKQILDADPGSAEALNNLAWLCARSGERPDEAVELATKAINTDKDKAAYLDTAAEAHFRAGNPDEAARLEKRALELQPGDPFMTKQLRRFERGAKGKTKIEDRG